MILILKLNKTRKLLDFVKIFNFKKLEKILFVLSNLLLSTTLIFLSIFINLNKIFKKLAIFKIDISSLIILLKFWINESWKLANLKNI